MGAASKRLLKEIPTEEEMTAILIDVRDMPDHAAALIGTSYLDHALKILLQASYRELNSEDYKRMFDGAVGGILGTTSAKIRMAFAQRLIGEDTYKDLLLINDMRNVFAHALHKAHFADVNILKDCKSLRFAQDPRFSDPCYNGKEIFAGAVLDLFIGLRQRLNTYLITNELMKPDKASP